MADPLERCPARDLEAGAAGATAIDLRRAVRHALEAACPELRILAEGFLAEGSPIDLLGVGAEGELIAVRIAPTGADPETLTRVLADLSWLRARRLELLKRAAGLGIDPSSEPRGILVASGFARETRAAIDHFPAQTIELWRLRSARAPDQAVLEREPSETGAERPLTAPPSPSAFRTGLQDSDLG